MTFAQILNGTVIAIFSCDQDPAYWPGVEELQDDDQRILDFKHQMMGGEVLPE